MEGLEVLSSQNVAEFLHQKYNSKYVMITSTNICTYYCTNEAKLISSTIANLLDEANKAGKAVFTVKQEGKQFSEYAVACISRTSHPYTNVRIYSYGVDLPCLSEHLSLYYPTE